MSPPFIQTQPGGVCLAVKVQPRASRNEIGEPLGNELKIKVTAPPVDSAANEAVTKFLAPHVHPPRRSVQLLRGHASRHKIVFLQGLSTAEVLKKLFPTAHPSSPSEMTPSGKSSF